MADTTAAWPDGHARLRDAILNRLAGDPIASRRLSHHRATIGEAAAFILTAETLRTAKGRIAAERDPDAVATKVAEDGRRLMAEIARKVGHGDDTIVLAASDGGKALRRFDAHQNRLWCLGGTGFVSPSFDGVRPTLPTLPVDLDALTGRLRSAITRHGGDVRSADAASLRMGEDGRLVFEMPDGLGDRGLDMSEYVLHAAHRRPSSVEDALQTYARRAALRDVRRDTGLAVRDRLRGDIERRIEGVDGLSIERIALYTVTGRTAGVCVPLDDPGFIFHAHVRRTSDTLRDATMRFVQRSDTDATSIGKQVDAMVAGHRRAHAARAVRGIEWEASSLALVLRAGVEPAEVERLLDETPDRVRLPGLKWAWARARAGRIDVRMPVGAAATWKYDRLEIAGVDLPRTTCIALAGQPAGRVVDERAIADATIRSVTSGGGATVVRIEPQWTKTGRTS